MDGTCGFWMGILLHYTLPNRHRHGHRQTDTNTERDTDKHTQKLTSHRPALARAALGSASVLSLKQKVVAPEPESSTV